MSAPAEDGATAGPDRPLSTAPGDAHESDKMANEETYSYLQRNRYTKATGAMKSAGVVDQSGKYIPPRDNLPGSTMGGSSMSDGRDVSTTTSDRRTSSGGNARGFAGTSRTLTQPDAPIAMTEFVKRNLPQAQVASASTSGYWAGTPEFQAQAMDVIREHKRLSGLTANGPNEESDPRRTRKAESALKQGEAVPQMLDVTDRIRGYEKMREWVEAGLDGWKPELREILYPVFVHTFLDLVDYCYPAAAKSFFQDHRSEHSILHHDDLSTLSAIDSELHIVQFPISMRFRTERYSVNLSKGGFGLLVGWLSDLGLEALWDVGKGSIRGKDSVRNIIHSRVKINVADTSACLTSREIRHAAGLLGDFAGEIDITADAFNAAQPLKLGIPPLELKLIEERNYQLQQQEQERTRQAQHGTATANGRSADGGDGDDEMNGLRDDSAPQEPAILILPPEEDHGISRDAPSSSIPALSERIPQRTHNNFSLVDLDKEVKSVADRRKRIRLGPVVDDIKASAGLRFPVSLSLPSVCAYTLFDGGEGVTSTAFSPDSSILAAGSAESCIRVWDLKANRRAAARSQDDAADVPRNTQRRKSRDDQPVTKLIGHSGPVYSLSFDPMAGAAVPPKHMLSSSQDGTVRLWDLERRRNLVVYKGHSEPVWDVQWGPLGVYFATASRDRTARLWITDRVTPVRIFAGHLADVDCLTFHPNSMYLATGSSDRTCRLWDVQRGECVRVFVDHDDAVNCVAISPDGRMLASACLDNTIKLMDLHHGTVVKTFVGHTQAIQSLSFSAESSILVSGGSDCTVRCWDVKGAGGIREEILNGNANHLDPNAPLESVDLLTTLRTKRTPITSVHFTPRNLCMVAGTYLDEEIR